MRLLAALCVALFAVSFSLPARAENALSLNGAWAGTFHCQPGNSYAAILLRGLKDGRVTATFKFGPYDYAATPNAPTTGEFSMSGRFDGRTGALTLNAGAWTKRPAAGTGGATGLISI